MVIQDGSSQIRDKDLEFLRRGVFMIFCQFFQALAAQDLEVKLILLFYSNIKFRGFVTWVYLALVDFGILKLLDKLLEAVFHFRDEEK